MAQSARDWSRRKAPHNDAFTSFAQTRVNPPSSVPRIRLRTGHPATVSHAVGDAKRRGDKGLERLKRQVERLKIPVQ